MASYGSHVNQLTDNDDLLRVIDDYLDWKDGVLSCSQFSSEKFRFLCEFMANKFARYCPPANPAMSNNRELSADELGLLLIAAIEMLGQKMLQSTRNGPLIQQKPVLKLNEDRIVESLIMGGANPSVVDNDGQTALHRAAAFNNIRAVQCLIINKADISVADNAGQTPFDIAIACSFSVIAVLLLKASSCGEREAVQRLPALVLNSTDDNGETALHYFVEQRNAEVVGLLLRLGAEIGILNDDLKSPLARALKDNAGTIARLILTSRPDAVEASRLDEAVDESGSTIFHSSRVRTASEVGELIDQIMVNNRQLMELRDFAGNTPLHRRCNDKLVAAALFAARRGLLDVQNMAGRTPLHMAVQRGDVDAVSCLLIRGADVSIVDDLLCTPLHYWNHKLYEANVLKHALKHATDKRSIYGDVTPLLWTINRESIYSRVRNIVAAVTGLVEYRSQPNQHVYSD